jgi:hypothetical protein
LSTFDEPPRPLGDLGRDLWNAIRLNYTPTDYIDAELLYQACAASERAESCRQLIEREGEVITTSSGCMKDHPLLKHELANRAFAARALCRIIADAETEHDSRPGHVKRRETYYRGKGRGR